ncbi:hypothetical protein L1987_43523 [Smallanthus sonchifolius]|uniref:Uncharacterized protein n=1 Tax=Smallanthus sonchifolius TaxID=185202 RepID=A0ACB9GLP8_9ASTR|nr:hypothetical protein L1987_43523 [Smallanthus sonchifolius]
MLTRSLPPAISLGYYSSMMSPSVNQRIFYIFPFGYCEYEGRIQIMTLDVHGYKLLRKAEYGYVKRKGIAIFLMEAGMIGTLETLWEVFPLFTNTGWGEF